MDHKDEINNSAYKVNLNSVIRPLQLVLCRFVLRAVPKSKCRLAGLLIMSLFDLLNIIPQKIHVAKIFIHMWFGSKMFAGEKKNCVVTIPKKVRYS